MYKTNQINVRNFYTNHLSRYVSVLDGSDEPTYVGFALKFSFFNEDYRDTWGVTRSDRLLSGLLLDRKEIDSTIGYLERVGRVQEAATLEEFISQLKFVEKEKPWYFQSITGLEDLMKPLPIGVNWRGKDKIITIDTLESIDFRMSYLANLYRKASYDMTWKRNILPLEKRWFNMRIIVSEIRNMSLVLNTLENAQNLANESPITVGDDNLNRFETASVWGSTEYESLVKAEMSEVQKVIDDNMTYHIFELRDCEFVFDEFPWLTTVTNTKPDAPATMKFKIKVGDVLERHQYGIWNWILADSSDWFALDSVYGSGSFKGLPSYAQRAQNWGAWYNPIDSTVEVSKLTQTKDQVNKQKSSSLQNQGNVNGETPWYKKAMKEIESQGPYAIGLANEIDPNLGKNLNAINQQYKKGKQLYNIYNKTVNDAKSILKGLNDIGSLKDLYNTVQSIKGLVNSIAGGVSILKGGAALNGGLTDVYDSTSGKNRGIGNAGQGLGPLEYGKIRNYDEDQMSPRGKWKNMYVGKTNENNDLLPIELDNNYDKNNIKPFAKYDTTVNDKISPIEFGETTKNINIEKINKIDTPINKDINPVEQDETPINEQVNPVDLGETPVNEQINPVDLGETPVNKDINPIDLGKTPVNKEIDPIDLGKTPVNDDINPVDLGETPVNEQINPVDLGETPINEQINPIDIIETPKNTNINSLDKIDTNINKDINTIDNLILSKNNTISKLDSFDTNVNRISLGKIDIPETQVNKEISSLNLQETKINSSMSPIEQSIPSVNSSIENLEFGETKINTNISSIEQSILSINKEISELIFDETKINSEIDPIKLDGYKNQRIKLGKINLEGYIPSSRIQPKNVYEKG